MAAQPLLAIAKYNKDRTLEAKIPAALLTKTLQNVSHNHSTGFCMNLTDLVPSVIILCFA